MHTPINEIAIMRLLNGWKGQRDCFYNALLWCNNHPILHHIIYGLIAWIDMRIVCKTEGMGQGKEKRIILENAHLTFCI